MSELNGKNLTAAESQKQKTAGGSESLLSVGQLDCIYTSPMSRKKKQLRATNYIFLGTEITQLYLINQ